MNTIEQLIILSFLIVLGWVITFLVMYSKLYSTRYKLKKELAHSGALEQHRNTLYSLLHPNISKRGEIELAKLVSINTVVIINNGEVLLVLDDTFWNKPYQHVYIRYYNELKRVELWAVEGDLVVISDIGQFNYKVILKGEVWPGDMTSVLRGYYEDGVFKCFERVEPVRDSELPGDSEEDQQFSGEKGSD